MRRQNKVKRENKKKEDRERLEEEGRKKNKNQLHLREWIKGGGDDTLGDVGKITREGKDKEGNWIRHDRKRGRKRG